MSDWNICITSKESSALINSIPFWSCCKVHKEWMSRQIGFLYGSAESVNQECIYFWIDGMAKMCMTGNAHSIAENCEFLIKNYIPIVLHATLTTQRIYEKTSISL